MTGRHLQFQLLWPNSIIGPRKYAYSLMQIKQEALVHQLLLRLASYRLPLLPDKTVLQFAPMHIHRASTFKISKLLAQGVYSPNNYCCVILRETSTPRESR